MGINEGAVLFVKRLFKTGDWIIPEQFGAVGDGATDDIASITQALQTGKVVSLGAKTYAVKDLRIRASEVIILALFLWQVVNGVWNFRDSRLH